MRNCRRTESSDLTYEGMELSAQSSIAADWAVTLSSENAGGPKPPIDCDY